MNINNVIFYMEALSKDVLSDDFIRIFRPIFFVLRILGLLRVNIQHRYPTAPTLLYQVYSNVFWIVNTVCVIYYLLRCEDAFESQYAKSTLKFGVLMNGINGVLIICRNNIYQSNKVSQMYVKLQKIERFLNMKNSKDLNRQLSRSSTLIVSNSCFLCIIWLTFLNGLFMKKTCVALIVTLAMGIGLHMEMAQVIFIIRLIRIRVTYINDLLQEKTQVGNKSYIQSYNERKLFSITSAPRDSANEPFSEAVRAMFCTLDALADFTELFQFSIFCFICQVFIWNLVAIHNLVSSIKEQVTADLDLLLCVTPFLIFMQILMWSLCLNTEYLSYKLERSRKLCIHIISVSINKGKSRDHAKQMILLVEGRRSVSIYNIYTLGARLPLHLLAITASYTVVLLQFVLL